jgi:hypothetical protein
VTSFGGQAGLTAATFLHRTVIAPTSPRVAQLGLNSRATLTFSF